MSWRIDKTVLESVIFVGLLILGWFPWGLLRSLFKGAEEEAGKRKKNGIGLV
jgi:hypothetical protein